MNETWSLTETVQTVMADVGPLVKELLVVTSPQTLAASLATINDLRVSLGDILVVHKQTLPHLGGALREAFGLARASHILMMASDLETDPADAKLMVNLAIHNPDAIITASRWASGGAFTGYGWPKLVANAVFQSFFALLFRCKLTDLTYGYRLMPTQLVQAIDWHELGHPFLFETLVKPLRLGTAVIEVPSRWTPRREGRSANHPLKNLAYFRTGLQTLLTPPRAILRATSQVASDTEAGTVLQPFSRPELTMQVGDDGQ
jgi:hypothetical protein